MHPAEHFCGDQGCVVVCVLDPVPGYIYGKFSTTLFDTKWDFVPNELMSKMNRAQKHSHVAFPSHVCTFAGTSVLQAQQRERSSKP